jgi:hypothetical protein
MTIQPNATPVDRFSSYPTSALTGTIAWSAIIVGALASIGLSFLLNLFNIAIGLTAISTDLTGHKALAIGGFIGLLIGAIATMFFSGWLAGYLARPTYRRCNLGGIYGFAAWCLGLLLTILTASSVGHFIHSSTVVLSDPTAATTEVYINQNRNAPAVQMAPDDNTLTVNPAKIAKGLGVSAFLVFIIFFIGAVSSTIGGYWGGGKTNKSEYA